MKGFIEVKIKSTGKKVLLNLSLVKDITEDSVICFENEYYYAVEETYEEIKELIKKSYTSWE